MSGAWAPNPPNFYKQFTTANLERVAKLKEEADGGIFSLPSELRYLVPPEPPADGVYKLFGQTRTIHNYLASLSDQGITQLYPDGDSTEESKDGTTSNWTLDRGKYLRSIVRSVLLSFLELTGVLAQDPKKNQKKLEDITVLFQNAHHLINEYRPHQARESLILKMEEEVEKVKEEIKELQRMKDKIDALIGEQVTEDVHMNGHEDSNVPNELSDGQRREMEIQQCIWEALNRELPA